ncbi:hypothetical protein MUO32_03835 [Shinella sp. CPCC 101442]|uniref:hypothetical protein n=1 Tax=Shinella sp. CPCC 101442 TaxID=2932265 RepID=UPI002152F52E|nr:hypothetical protein [Shinella sp. CPCC 101442]MCR6498158.1 hypothetical protein [Shinella sp. CPCC 101442]
MRSRARHHRPRRPVAPIEPPRFTVGRDHHGWWVVEDRLGRVGGIFVTEDAALHYALEESNRDRNAVRCQKPSKHVEFRLGS